MNKNRGMLLEQIINQSVDYYWKNKIAFIEKKGLPIKFKKVDASLNKNEIKKVEDAYIYKKSTVDYIGCYNGKFVAFEAKSINEDRLPASNIKAHQMKYLLDIIQNHGLGFFIIFFALHDEFYIVEADILATNMKKSLSYEEIKNIGSKIELTYPGIIDFLPYVNNLF